MQYYGTLGPSCSSVQTLADMFRAGMTGVRLNMSHGDLDENGRWLDMLFEAAKQCGVAKPQVLIDLRGPELRLGKLEHEIVVRENEEIVCVAGNTAPMDALTVPPMFLQYAEAGDHFLVDDGKLEFVVESKMPVGQQSAVEAMEDQAQEVPGACALTARAIRGGAVKSGKSLAIVGKELPMPTLTESDHKNIALAAQCGVTGVMLPFVRNKNDLLTLRRALHAAGADHIEIFAKIENMQGVNALEELLPYCDHVVIARGDLGNAMPLWKLPGVQKRIAARCRTENKPFMVVTQMLDSMIERAVPTRAEVLDIYNAVLDGAASVMLTGETAAGKHPVAAMEFLVKTGLEAERDYRCFSDCSLLHR